MGKPEQILIIEPRNELRFRGPFAETTVISYIKLMNPSNYKIHFKIKTTAPRRYCVRPNSGTIKPKESSQVAVTLQPFDFDPSEKPKHKFMVQALVAQDDEDNDDSADVWKDVDPDQLMESKLKCVFENPVSETTKAETAPTTVTTKSEANTNNDTNKGIGDSVKIWPKVSGETEEKLIKAAEEVNQLREEESALRQENLQLKEDLLQLRNVLLVSEATLASAKNHLTSQTSIESPANVTSIIIAVVMVIVGYVLGKMI